MQSPPPQNVGHICSIPKALFIFNFCFMKELFFRKKKNKMKRVSFILLGA